MEDQIDEYISVEASFSLGKVVPRVIRHRGREILIKKVTLFYPTTEGDLTVFHFSLVGNGAVYHVVFYPEKLLWKIRAIHPA